MESFGLTTDETAEAMDFMVRAADASVAEVDELRDAMTNVGSSAVAMGFSFEDVNTALAILSSRGIKGAEAGTALKSMMTNMMRTTPAVVGGLEELGVTLYDNEGVMRSLPDIIGQFSSALHGTREITTEVGGRTAEQNKHLELAKKAYAAAENAIYKHNAGLKVLSDTSLEKYYNQLDAASAEMASLQSISGTLTKKTVALTQEQRNQYIQTITGTYGMKAMNTMMAE